ncbi:MAG: DUF2778 domain-containing protein [Alphaproteobacteria bacterium]|nr:MAG: DUF2778 domain-containing protein [Alphaproteobacteria bacterium]
MAPQADPLVGSPRAGLFLPQPLRHQFANEPKAKLVDRQPSRDRHEAMDDPGHVSERNVGATPPNVYELKPRERLFHGVQALRMVPVGGTDMLGRSGLLAHSYMLGANGDSNGCVSIKNYENFLRAFNNGEIKRLVVVANLGDSMSSARRSVSQS